MTRGSANCVVIACLGDAEGEDDLPGSVPLSTVREPDFHGRGGGESPHMPSQPSSIEPLVIMRLSLN